MQIVVTMTSWTKRINYVSKAIYRFLKTQTVKPNVFYIWLAEEEFPNKEKDLPEELLLLCESFNIIINWTKHNEYAFKRWNVYPKHNNDLVISIDDDMIYYNTLISDCYNECIKNNIPHVIHYSACGGEIEIKNGISYFITQKYKGPSVKNYFFGQCAFCPNSFPLECITEENKQLKLKICPKTDEAWIHPFLIKNNIPISFLPYKQSIENNELQSIALRNNLHNNKCKINNKEYKRADVYRYMVIKSSTELTNAWLNQFPTYNINEFTYSNEELINYIKE